MEIKTLFGLPAHPLLVHVPVVVVPLALLVAIAALWPRVRRPAALVAAALAVVGGIGVALAAQSGEQLQEQVPGSDRVQDHAEQGDAARTPALVFAVVAAVAAGANEALRRRGRSTAQRTSRTPDTWPRGDAARGREGAWAPRHHTAGAPAGTTTLVREEAPRAPAGDTAPAPATSRAGARWLAAAVLAASEVAGAVATTAVVRAGHSGATAVWHDTNGGSSRHDGGDDGAVGP
jgi:hypothetical protein